MSGHQEIWCQPADQPKRQFLVMFDDPQMDLAVFSDEAEARAYWEKANLDWTCYLLGTLPRNADHSRLREEVERLEGALKTMRFAALELAQFASFLEISGREVFQRHLEIRCDEVLRVFGLTGSNPAKDAALRESSDG